ncbi:adenylyl-sulfate kinase [Helicobacter sp. 14348-15]|uniref:adenylyl-sulfate kinase n=1 Tax=Helicobacter colisuis TaxID=2949739 RepID=UPI00202B11DE|nr:adenylyl-sulfate kinase [Helicobacter colisuis]MCL9821313.1 adenylyl-sulfate kinase [Helicobacter colisuis]
MRGALIYITGLSGSGKTTLAKELVENIEIQMKIKAIFLDGDILRECVNNNDYSIQGRFAMASYYVKVAKLLVDQGFIVVLSTISMFEAVRAFNRENFKNYLEVFLNVSEKIRINRDPKNFYKNNTQNMAGLNQDVELPKRSHLVYSDNFNINNACRDIIEKLKEVNAKFAL